MNRDEIIARNSIVDFVRNRGHELKQAGENFVTSACPVAQHKRGHRPVMIYPAKQSFYCHDCKLGGSVIDWEMHEKNVTAGDAMSMLGGGRNGSESVEKKSKGRIVATYDYTDESGKLLFQCVRYLPKDFSQRRPDGKGGWIENLKGARRVLYRLPEVIGAQIVCVAEGEKDADNLRSLGITATTNPMGAGKWRDEYSETLRGKDVVVFGDVGDPKGEGEKHTAQVIQSLTGAARSIKHAKLPDGFHDVSDYIGSLPKESAAQIIQALIKQSADGEKPIGNQRLLGELLDKVVKVLLRFVIFPIEEQPIVVALWVVHTWLLDAFDFTPYLHVYSAETMSGKSRMLEVLECLVNKPWKIESVSVAALFRKIDRDWPTLLYDEIDNVFRGIGRDDDTRDLRSCLNSGYKRGGKFTRCVGQNANLDTKDFATFCPKALAGIGNRLNDTLSNRCIPIELERQHEVKAAPFRDGQAKALSGLRADIETWGRQPGLTDVLRAARPTLPQELSDRQMDNCAPLLAIADLAAGDWPQKARKAIIKLCTNGDTVISIGVQLLADIKRIFDETGLDKIATKELLEKLVEIEEAPWPLMFEDALKHDRLQTAAAKLAKRLKPYKAPGGERIEPRSIKLADGSVSRGYHRDDFALAWKRYLPRIPATDATSATSATAPYEKAGSVNQLSSASEPLPERQPLPNLPEKVAQVAQVAPVGEDAEDRLGFMPVEQLLKEVRDVFPNATVIS